MGELAGRIAVITGASSGIGEAAAKRLAGLGAGVCLVARRKSELERVRAAIREEGGQAWVYVADLMNEGAVAACAREILDAHERVDVLINNAGHSIRRGVCSSLDRYHDYQRTMQLNYFAPVQLMLAFLPRFLDQGRGHIINISSVVALIPTPQFAAYTASKCALDGFSRTLAAELLDTDIRVSVLNFPLVRTPMAARTRNYRYLPQMDPYDAAGWIVEAVERRPLRMTTRLGAAWGLATAALPAPTVRLTRRLLTAIDRYLQRRVEGRTEHDGGRIVEVVERRPMHMRGHRQLQPFPSARHSSSAPG